MKQKDKIFMTVGGTVVTGLAVATGVYLFGGNSNTSTNSTTPTTTTSSTGTTSDVTASTSDAGSTTTTGTSTTPATSTATTSTSGYKDGTYTATANYSVPHGSNSLTAKITIASGKITDVTITNNYTDNESGMYIDSFMNSIKSAVVGQSVSGISLSRVGGATLTTDGFSQALDSVISQAKA